MEEYAIQKSVARIIGKIAEWQKNYWR